MGYTIQNVIQGIFSTIPGAPFEDTVDTVKSGDPSQEVTSIVTTFQANIQVILKAAEIGANFIITHEPTYYNHRDETDWLADDPVYLAKRKLLEENHIVVWRFHDSWHAHKPDGIYTGVIHSLGWENYQNKDNFWQFDLPATTLTDLAHYLKEKLDISTLRVVGDSTLRVQKAALLVGGWGGYHHIQTMGKHHVDVLIAGEIAEWETSEYVRDAIAIGEKIGLIVAGHEPTEEGGMLYLCSWLNERFPGISVTHIPSTSPFTWL